MTIKRTVSRAVLLLAAIAAVQPAANANTARFEIRGYVPLICNAQIVSANVSNGRSLVIDAVVNQSCNAKHQLSVRYLPAAVSNDGALSVVYNGQAPLVAVPGLRSFGQERFAKAARALHIVYSGGSTSERRELVQTVAIEVSPL